MAQINFCKDELLEQDSLKARRIETAIQDAAAVLQPDDMTLDCHIMVNAYPATTTAASGRLNIVLAHPGWSLSMGAPLDASMEDLLQGVQFGLLGRVEKSDRARRGLPF